MQNDSDDQCCIRGHSMKLSDRGALDQEETNSNRMTLLFHYSQCFVNNISLRLSTSWSSVSENLCMEKRSEHLVGDCCSGEGHSVHFDFPFTGAGTATRRRHSKSSHLSLHVKFFNLPSTSTTPTTITQHVSASSRRFVFLQRSVFLRRSSSSSSSSSSSTTQKFRSF